MLHQVGIPHYFMRKMHGQTTPKCLEYFPEICPTTHKVMYKRYTKFHPEPLCALEDDTNGLTDS